MRCLFFRPSRSAILSIASDDGLLTCPRDFGPLIT
jgi:hypothetical protein